MTHIVLDQPVWHALSETHQALARNFHGVKCYDPAYCPFGAWVDTQSLPEALDVYAQQIDSFFIVGEKPLHSSRLRIQQELVCLQMVLDQPITHTVHSPISLLSPTFYPQIFDLVQLVQPGYFRPQTPQMGAYYGIFQDEELVAITGERMKLNDFTEVSAVVTHPDCTGRGYAKQLITYTTRQIFAEGKIPFLHVAASNIPAIRLYEKLGFRVRREISFWQLKQA
ncbi:MAG: GNAT family N-acetyltransferase [Bacteroidota bacterium]